MQAIGLNYGDGKTSIRVSVEGGASSQDDRRRKRGVAARSREAGESNRQGRRERIARHTHQSLASPARKQTRPRTKCRVEISRPIALDKDSKSNYYYSSEKGGPKCLTHTPTLPDCMESNVAILSHHNSIHDANRQTIPARSRRLSTPVWRQS